MLSAAGFDGHIDIFSIMGGSSQAQSQRHADQVTSNWNLEYFKTFNLESLLPNASFLSVKRDFRSLSQISNSFANMDPFGTGQALPPLQLPQTVAPPATSMPLKKPPKWIRRPVGATFAVCPVLLMLFSLSFLLSVSNG